MAFDRQLYDDEFELLLGKESEHKFLIRKSNNSFKIKKFIKKGIESFALAKTIKDSKENAKDYWTITICYYSMLYLAKAAILTKGYETDDHYSTQIALGHLLVPNELEKEDLELLDKAYKIFEDDYVDYFEDARKESSNSRYSATKVYTKRRVEEVFEEARSFISKITVILKEWQ